MRYTIRHTINTDKDTFWNRVFFDDEFNKALFEQHLGFKLYNVLAMDKKDDGSVYRKIECTPPTELPGPAKKIFGDSMSYVEEGRFDPSKQRFEVDVTPKVGADKIKTHVSIWVEPRGDKQIDRVVEVDNTIKVFGVGGMLESFVEKQMRSTYDTAASFTNRWLADKGL